MALLGSLYFLMGLEPLPASQPPCYLRYSPDLENTPQPWNGIDPSLEEAGIAFGNTKWGRLKKFEIPLAMPVIVSGSSYSNRYDHWDSNSSRSCWSWGLAFILWELITWNASLDFNRHLISHFGHSILMLFSNGWKKAKLRTIVAAFAVMVLVWELSTCYDSNKEKENLVIAGKLGPEPEILMNNVQASY